MTLVPAVQVVGLDVEVPTRTPQRLIPTVESVTGTPGTGGFKSIGSYHGFPVPDPHQVWRFNVYLPPLVSQQKMPIVQAIDPGFDNTSQEAYPIGGRHHFSANFFDATELHLQFYDDENQSPIEYIYAWKKLIRNYNPDTGLDDGTYNYPHGTNGYFQDISVYLLDAKNESRYKIIYRDCFPTVMSPIRLDYGPSARTVIAQSFAVNRVLTLVLGTQKSTANPTPAAPTGAAFNLRNVQTLQV